jgi:hypothetical protein
MPVMGLFLCPYMREEIKMDLYWDLISIKHQDKLRFLAKTSGITIDQALRHIVCHLQKEWDTASCPHYLKELKETKDIEDMIDIIAK